MSSLQIGIVGLPNVGKSTLFNALTKNNVLAANYPFATIEPNVGIVAIPDNHLAELAKLFPTAKIVPATTTFVDIAGLVAGANKGEGLGNQFLSHIRSTQAICHIVRAFQDPNITHIDSHLDPKRDIDIINTELVLADLQTVTNRLPKLQKEVKADPKLRPIMEKLAKAKGTLDQNRPLHSVEAEFDDLSDLQLITAKPVIYLFNVDEKTLSDQKLLGDYRQLVTPAPVVFVDAKLENELKDLDESDAIELLSTYGQSKAGLEQLIQAAYQALGLQSYLTAGEKEVRAWTIRQGSTAPEAAGAIHTDFQKGFIAAEVVSFDDLIAAGSKVTARSEGKLRTEGKNYIVQPDDVIEFRFNV